jgi:hypothetical protein
MYASESKKVEEAMSQSRMAWLIRKERDRTVRKQRKNRLLLQAMGKTVGKSKGSKLFGEKDYRRIATFLRQGDRDLKRQRLHPELSQVDELEAMQKQVVKKETSLEKQKEAVLKISMAWLAFKQRMEKAYELHCKQNRKDSFYSWKQRYGDSWVERYADSWRERPDPYDFDFYDSEDIVEKEDEDEDEICDWCGKNPYPIPNCKHCDWRTDGYSSDCSR